MDRLTPSQMNDYYRELYAETGECLIWRGGTSARGYGRRSVRGRMEYLHRLVWEDAHGPVPRGLVVKHRCDNKLCYRLDHLILGSYYGNSREAVERGLNLHGERIPSAKLTDAGVREILASTERGADLARRFGVSRSAVCQIRTGRTWKHLGRDAS